MEKKGTFDSPAVALANNVFPKKENVINSSKENFHNFPLPVPGGPQSNAPLGIFAPKEIHTKIINCYYPSKY